MMSSFIMVTWLLLLWVAVAGAIARLVFDLAGWWWSVVVVTLATLPVVGAALKGLGL